MAHATGGRGDGMAKPGGPLHRVPLPDVACHVTHHGTLALAKAAISEVHCPPLNPAHCDHRQLMDIVQHGGAAWGFRGGRPPAPRVKTETRQRQTVDHGDAECGSAVDEAAETCTSSADLICYAMFERPLRLVSLRIKAPMDYGLTALGYVGIGSAKLDEWEAFATRLLGMQQVDRAGAVRAFRMDDRKQRLVIARDQGEGLAFLGWEVADAGALDALAARLDAHGIAVQRAPRALADERHVAGLVVFHDPEGNRLEAFHGPAVAIDPFQPGRAISGFRTGPLGMGHVVMHVSDVAKLKPFYCGLLGFRVTDYGTAPYEICFFHINGRHHSFAMFGSGQRALHHLMVELSNLDDVGQGYDLAEMQAGRVAATLGRHTNDHMTSFYAHTPSNFFVEYGWGGRVIEPESWQPHQVHGGYSLWGHDRRYLSAEQRATQRDMRLALASQGQQAPVTVPDCPWLKAVATVA